ncbi:MAG TPA: helix-turn-helix domain-containing protein [Gaiellaceae bacterium]|jgi:AcrR family transcriptional regulator|nr:helix-turn-helix domain-containing protein [Gaiellaceae bacterium]
MYARKQRTPPKSRQRVLETVRELLQEGSFHESTVEQVAARAGVSRATVYQQFGSRLGLVDAICEGLDLGSVKEADDIDTLLERTTSFWASEETLHAELYGAAAIDPAAGEFVARQTNDRHSHLAEVFGKEALPTLALLTSFESYVELRRRTGLSERRVVSYLQDAASRLL